VIKLLLLKLKIMDLNTNPEPSWIVKTDSCFYIYNYVNHNTTNNSRHYVIIELVGIG
jgi:hypothetical protein